MENTINPIAYPQVLANNLILEMTKDQELVNRKKAVGRLVKKWKQTGLLEGLNRTKQETLSQLLENEAGQLRKQLLQETTYVGDIAGFNKIAFPLVRRVFAQLLANELVSVQPISLPAGLVFYLDFVTDRIKPGIKAGSVYGDRDTVVSTKAQGIGGQTGTGGFYRFGNAVYSNRLFLIASGAPVYDSTTALSDAVTGTLSGFNFTFDTAASVDTMSRLDMRIASSGELNFDTSSASAFRSLTSVKSLSADTYYGTYDIILTKIPASTSAVIYSNVYLAAASLSAKRTVVLLGRADTTVTDGNTPATNVGDFEFTSDIPQINLQIKSVQVNAQTKKLKTVWTPELAQDLNAYHSIDAEVELTNILSEQIAAEIDREILGDLLSVASVKAAWSRKIGRFVYVDSTGTIQNATNSSNAATFTNQAFFGTQKDWNQTFGEVALAVSNAIYKRNLRGGANWMVCSMEMATVLESMAPQFTAAISNGSDDLKFSLGIEKAGTLQGRYQVYKDPYFPASFVLCGYKGKGQLETGYVWAPYVPLIVTPTIFDPTNFVPTKAIMTRNAKQVIRPDFYGTIQVQDLTSWIGLAS